MKENITVKTIQVPKFTKLEDFRNKIIRCFKNINNKLDEENTNTNYDIKLFKMEKSQEIFNLIISHVNKNKFYKLNAEEIKFNNENNQKYLDNFNIFENKNNKNNINTLIVEVIPKNMIVKPFIRIQSDVFNCIQCQVKILSRDMIVYCDLCTQVNIRFKPLIFLGYYFILNYLKFS